MHHVRVMQATAHTPRATATDAPTATTTTPAETSAAAPDATDTAQKLQEAFALQASMKQRIAELEGELESIQQAQERKEESGYKGVEAENPSAKSVAEGPAAEELATLHGELERLRAAELQVSEELAMCVPLHASHACMLCVVSAY
jgi:hypothetical protein